MVKLLMIIALGNGLATFQTMIILFKNMIFITN